MAKTVADVQCCCVVSRLQALYTGTRNGPGSAGIDADAESVITATQVLRPAISEFDLDARRFQPNTHALFPSRPLDIRWMQSVVPVTSMSLSLTCACVPSRARSRAVCASLRQPLSSASHSMKVMRPPHRGCQARSRYVAPCAGLHGVRRLLNIMAARPPLRHLMSRATALRRRMARPRPAGSTSCVAASMESRPVLSQQLQTVCTCTLLVHMRSKTA
jgi:hypothetical protein